LAARVPAKLAAYFGEADLETISRAVDEAESRTAGEIRVHITHGLRPLERLRARAIGEFFRLGMDKTRGGTGVLLFVALKRRRFEIVADRGIDGKVPADTWDEIARETTTRIREDGLTKGICRGVHLIGEVLAAHVPRKEGDVDELPDEVSFDGPADASS
jgi:uncharacterized membrane protein